MKIFKNKFTTILAVVLLITLSTVTVFGDGILNISKVLNDNNYYEITGEFKLMPTIESKLTIPYDEKMGTIEHIGLVETETGVNMDIDYDYDLSTGDLELTITPQSNLSLNTSYDLKLFTSESRYIYEAKTDKLVNFKDYPTSLVQYEKNGEFHDVEYVTVEIPANPSKGFHFPYFLNIPFEMELDEDGYTVSTGEFPNTEFSC